MLFQTLDEFLDAIVAFPPKKRSRKYWAEKSLTFSKSYGGTPSGGVAETALPS
jgi:hypothetical protein